MGELVSVTDPDHGRTTFPLSSSIILSAFEERLDAGLFPERTRGGARSLESGLSEALDRSVLGSLGDAAPLDEGMAAALTERRGLYESLTGAGLQEGDSWRVAFHAEYLAYTAPIALDAGQLDAARDAFSLLTARTSLEPYSRAWKEEFRYDSRGNRLDKRNAWGSIAYRYDQENRVLSEGRRAYRYDDNGSLVKESLGLESIRYRYDEERRLVEAIAEEPSLWGRCHSDGMTGVAYAYDALGRRVSREESFSLLMGRGDEDADAGSGARPASWLAGEGRERSLYDGLGFDELVVFSDPVDKPGFGWRGKRETVALYLRATGELLSSTEYYQKKKGRFQPVPGRWDTAYYVSDALGSVVAALDTSGHVAETWRYDAFGAAYEGRFGGAYRYGYAGKAFDNVTGAYNYGFRDYDPGVGRFTSVDPIRDGANWYAYCASDPVNYVDLWGLSEGRQGRR